MERKKVFFRSHAAGRDFTDEEWTAYCEAEWRGQQEPETFKFGEFVFNINDVCLNPRKAVDFKNAAVQFQVKTAQSPDGRWTAGSEVDAPGYKLFPIGTNGSAVKPKYTRCSATGGR